MIYPLSKLERNKAAIVKSIDAQGMVEQRLMNLGVLPGVLVKIVHVAPLGDPIALECKGRKISLRHLEAAHIQVEPLGA